MKKIKLVVGSLLLATSLHATKNTFEFFSGTVYNMKEDIVLRQEHNDDIHIDNANLVTHPQTNPIYYGMRFSKWYDDDTAWEFEHIHQKLYIDDPEKIDPNITRWEITDGFNFFFLNKAWKQPKNNIVFRIGSGLVVAHPDVTLYGESNHKQGSGAITFGEGYHLVGFVLQTSIQKIFDLNKIWYLSTEVKATYAKANVPISDGDMNIQNRAIHWDFGVGYRF